MKNKYFPDEEIQTNDLYFICYMIERVARRIHKRNKYVVNTIGRESLVHFMNHHMLSQEPIKTGAFNLRINP